MPLLLLLLTHKRARFSSLSNQYRQNTCASVARTEYKSAAHFALIFWDLVLSRNCTKGVRWRRREEGRGGGEGTNGGYTNAFKSSAVLTLHLARACSRSVTRYCVSPDILGGPPSCGCFVNGPS